MTPFPVTVRYRFDDGGESRDGSFYCLPYDRSEAAVLGRLREAHRLAAWIEILEVRWRDGGAGQEGRPARVSGGGWQPRRHARHRMFKPAHVVTHDAVLDCVLLDLSPGGAQVCLMAGAELPDRVVLWLPTGESRPVRRVWQRGPLIGFEALGDAVPLS